PAGDEVETVTGEDRGQLGGLPRELAAHLGAGKTGDARLAKAYLQRRVAAERWQVVVGPGDRIDAEANSHVCPRRFRAKNAAIWTMEQTFCKASGKEQKFREPSENKRRGATEPRPGPKKVGRDEGSSARRRP